MLSLKNKNLSLTLAPEYGSNLISLKYKNQELIYTDEKLLKNHGFTGCLTVKITTSKDFTHAVVYTGEKEKYTAVEQQTCSTDAHNLDARGFTKEAHLIRLKLGGIHHGWTKYTVN